ncbi:MAG: hypothetical protein ACT6XY_02450 [Phreatobacter sp.]|uniref:hypothetical protein n=1 Tax=Phreatobacter sp. TaxID=1966341 RepID=UPI0040366938
MIAFDRAVADGSGRRAAALAVFVVAFALRLGAGLLAPGMHHPDEIFQSLEQAHRIVFGYGFVPWEFEHAIRSWILPGFLAGLMRASLVLGDGPHVYLPVIQAFLAALGAAAVTCIFLWAARIAGTGPALFGAAVAVLAPELVYFSSRALTEVVAGHLLVIALYLAFPGVEEDSGGRARLAVAGLLFGLAVAIRLQTAPAVALTAAYALWRLPLARALWIALGGAAAVAFAGILDWWTWGAPFLSYAQNLRYNIGHGVAAHFGVEPWYQYPALLAVTFGAALGLLLPLAVLGARAKPLLAALVVAVFVAHQPIGHKELRFLYPMMLLVEALAAIGLARAVAWLVERAPPGLFPWVPARARWWSAAGLMVLALVLVGRMANFILIPDQGLAWLRHRDIVQSALHVSRLTGVCGIGSYDVAWVWSGGYVHMHQPVPFHATTSLAEYREAAPAFNTILYPRGQEEALGIVGGVCFGARCVAQRPGTCSERPLAALPQQPPQISDLTPVRRLWPPVFPPRP